MVKTRICILGAGSIGCYLGGRLMQGGADVTLIGRARLAETLATQGLSVGQFKEAPVSLGPVEVATSPDALSGADVVGLCVKSQDTSEAAEQIAAFAPGAWVVSFQNGISNLETLRAALPEARISGAVVPFNVTSPAPGHYHRGTDGDLVIGPDVPPCMRKGFVQSSVGFRVVDDVDAYLWAKLLVNLNNALNALSGGPLRDGLVQRGYRRVLIAMIREGLAVAEAEGVDVATYNGRHPLALVQLMDKPDWLYRFLMDRIAKIDRTARSSMLDDLELERSPELDHLQGEIVRRAARHGLCVPINERVMEAAQDAFSQKKTPRLSGAEMERLFFKQG
ncbi:MAG: 2-dehydropantoate 2-reductase [Pseudomonadota bacterium]